MAAGIGAIFRAPLGGAILGAELLYRDDVESDALVPSFIATIVAYSIFGAVEGFSPIFGTQARFGFSDPAQLGWYALIGLACGLVGLLYIRGFYGLTDWFGRWTMPRVLRPAIAGFLVGCLGARRPRRPRAPATASSRRGSTGRRSSRSRSGWSWSCRSPRSWPPRSRSARAARAASSGRAW